MKWDQTPAGRAINASASCGRTNWSVDLDAAAQQGGLGRGDIVSKLNSWNENGMIDLTTSGVLNTFRVQKQWPPSEKDQQLIIDSLYKDLEVRELQALEKMQQVMDLVTDTKCFAASLASHFGDKLPEQTSECGHCTWCQTKVAVEKVTPPKNGWNSAAFFKILEAVPDRDDPRYLARIAFGISSPRVTTAKLSKSPVFGSMEDQDFVVGST